MELIHRAKRRMLYTCNKWAWIGNQRKYKVWFSLLICSVAFIPVYLCFDALVLSYFRSQYAYEKVVKLKDGRAILENLPGWHESKAEPSPYDHYSSKRDSIYFYTRGASCIEVYYTGGSKHTVSMVKNRND